MKILTIILLSIMLSSNQIKITVIDEATNETLCGVLEKNTKQYSDINGILKHPKNTKLDIDFISYEKIHIESIHNDTIIKMKSVK